MSHFFKHRGWALSKAKEVFKDSHKDQEVVAKRDKNLATVTVGGVLAFQQANKDAEGNFVEPYNHLSLR